ncbi:ck1 family protein kinase [Stylonychia lemnae]|uniref:Casein kinase I n=1 Tax=Stylonychia lemnae TaxID=5949 RepID=A0A078AKY0_STYLE|nr:ck1 family protein kinase [Stylonychia lemnae]|eukprot:CDW81483.1 ck1 family protein kinase [Stylonychia lemnae]
MIKDLQVPSIIGNGKYTFGKELGYGAYGKVCLYKNKAGIEFALKIFKEYTKFIEEKSIQLDLQAKNMDKDLMIPDIYYDGSQICLNDNEEQLSYLVFEYLPLSLEKYYKEKIALNIRVDLPKMITQVITLLKQLHKLGYRHRDIKPDNFRVKEQIEGDFQIYLIDFGSAKVIQEVQNSDQILKNVGTSATSSIFTTDDKIALEGDDLISALYTILILVEPANISWLEICYQIVGNPTMDQKQEMIAKKEEINEGQFNNKLCQRAVSVIKYLEKLRNTNLQKYQSGLEYDEVINFITNDVDNLDIRQKQPQKRKSFDIEKKPDIINPDTDTEENQQRQNILIQILYFISCCCIWIKIFRCCKRKRTYDIGDDDNQDAFNRENKQQMQEELINKDKQN